MTTEEKKWSTFLQKPKNPIPKCKSDKPIIPPDQIYRVIIRKQSVSSAIEKESQLEIPSDQNQEIIKENILSSEELLSNCNNCSEIEHEINTETEANNFISEMDISVGLIEQDAISSEISEDVSSYHEEKHVTFDQEKEYIESNETVLENEEQTLSGVCLENKLSEIQKQLQAMAELPTFIQGDLDELTKKISNIMYVVNEHIEAEKIEEEANEEIEKQNLEDIENNNDLSNIEDDNAEQEVTEDVELQYSVGELDEENIVTGNEEVENTSQIEEEIDPLVLDKIKKMEQVEAKNQLRKPPQRPIILPGGRRWCEEDDVKTSFRNVKMTDEKIDTTINTFTEVITGKTKGINFLKYQPHAKNMQFLQASEVYKLVHDIETPVMGICRRSGKILAENDYYEKKNEIAQQI